MRAGAKKRFRKQLPLYLMELVPALFVLVFAYGSMVGIIMAFQNYVPRLPGDPGWYVFGSPWAGNGGMEHFITMFTDTRVTEIILNTLLISVLKIVTGTLFPILVAIFMNEIRSSGFRRFVQTCIFLPYFVSWVIIAGILRPMLAPDGNFFASFLNMLGLSMPRFYENPHWFRFLLVISNLWKEAGYGVIIYIAAITVIDQNLYEAVAIDGGGYFKKAIHVTLPGMLPIIVLNAVLACGTVLSAGFEQVYNLSAEILGTSGEILDTYIYKMAANESGRYSFATAVGLFKSVISLFLISGAYFIAYKCFDYKIF